MTQFTAPTSVTQNIARAKSLVQRDEPIRALDTLMAALESFEPGKLAGRARYAVEVTILECVNDMSRMPAVRRLLEEIAKSDQVNIVYAPGAEKKLLAVLRVLRKALQEVTDAGRRAETEKAENRKKSLLEKGKAHLAAGEGPLGKAVFRNLADEFGHEPGVLALVGSVLLEAKLHYEAAEALEQALEAFPTESKVYADLVTCYTELREYAKAEEAYLKAIKQFGKHPKTLVNMAKLYLAWNKKDKAFDAANLALKQDPSNIVAQEIVKQTA